MVFCYVRDAAATRGQYLALSKAWRSCLTSGRCYCRRRFVAYRTEPGWVCVTRLSGRPLLCLLDLWPRGGASEGHVAAGSSQECQRSTVRPWPG